MLQIQILDSSEKAEPSTHDCGSLYDMLAPSTSATRKPGQWTHATITARGSKIVIFLNGRKIIETDVDLWTEPHKNPAGLAARSVPG